MTVVEGHEDVSDDAERLEVLPQVSFDHLEGRERARVCVRDKV